MPAAREQASHPTNPRRSGRVLTRAAEHQRSGVVAAALAAGGGTARAALTARGADRLVACRRTLEAVSSAITSAARAAGT